MKIEKINDNQIRCTLTPADLADRQLKISELVTGSEKAKSLFKDMMQQAASEFGFEADDMPLMIEAVPASPDSIVLIITKVDDPEELDFKLPKFGAALDADSRRRNVLDKLEGAEELLDLFQKVKEAVAAPEKATAEVPEDSLSSRIRLFSFVDLDSVILTCKLLKTIYHGDNTLYKDVEEGIYILLLSQSEHSTSEFNKICNMLSEYASVEKATSATLAFLEEHCEVIATRDAVQQLGNM